MQEEAAAFTSQQVLRLTGISKRQLDYWITRGLVKPEIDSGEGRGRVRLFSFRDLLQLRVAAWLRSYVSLQLIRRIVSRWRVRGFEEPLAEVTFGVVAGTQEVAMQLPDGSWEGSTRPDQLFMRITIPVQEFAESLQKATSEDRRERRRVGRIERRRGVLGSEPVLAGTRIPTKAIWSLHAGGFTTEQILASYPGLEAADIKVALDEERRRRSKRRVESA